MKLLRSPHAHAEIVAVDAAQARGRAGRAGRASPTRDAPALAFSTARHEHATEDPDDTVLLDGVVRFAGQRVAAVVADTGRPPRQAAALVERQLRGTAGRVRPRGGHAPGAPLLHARQDAGRPDRRAGAQRGRRGAQRDRRRGAPGFAQADAVVERDLRSPAGPARHLETHAAIGWLDGRPAGPADQHPGAVPDPRRARAGSSACPPSGCGSRRRGWAAASAASRRC